MLGVIVLSRKISNAFRIKNPIIKSLALCVIYLSFVSISNSQSLPSYGLGAEDKLMLKVWDIRNGDPYQWAALTGEFSIGADGLLSLPIIGEIRATGESTSTLASKIGSALQQKVGLSSRPDASVQIIRYRPYYIMGEVEKPGRYEYQPNLTVLQAVSTASGFVRPGGSQLYGVVRDTANSRGEIRVLTAERMALLARQARLAAEIGARSEINYPLELKNTAGISITKEETLLFNGRSESLTAKLAAISQAKSVLSSQLSALEAKNHSIGRQLELTRQDLSQVNDLMNKGMAIATRRLAAEQIVAGYESSQIDVQVAALKARQDLSQADRDIIDLKTKFRTDALQEATEIRAKIDITNEKIRTAKNLVKQGSVMAGNLMRREDTVEKVVPSYSVSRPSSSKVIALSGNDEIQPGDVLQVDLLQGPNSETMDVSSFDAELEKR